MFALRSLCCCCDDVVLRCVVLLRADVRCFDMCRYVLLCFVVMCLCICVLYVCFDAHVC